jgi:hypothetical protein
MYVSGGTGDFADLAFTQGFPIYDVQTSQGGSGAFTSGWSFAYDSSGKSTSGVTLRVRDDSANKANAWPRKHFIDNNIMDIGNAVTIAGYQGNTTTGFDSGVLGYSPTQAVSFQMQTDMDLTRNTIIRRSVGPGTGWVPGLFMESQRMVVHGQSGAPDATMPATFNIHDNVDEGTAGKFTSSATLSTTCRLTLDDYWEPNNGRVYMSGNVATYGDTRDFYALLNTTNNAEYGDSVCPGWKRVYGRTSPSMPFQDTDTSVTVSSNQGTFTFSSAPRLISGSRFCVTASTPSNLVGCYTLPTAVDATSTSWTNVSLPGVPNNTYTGVTLDSAINFTDYNNRNYRLAGGSIFKGTGRDGADPGADQNVVEWATETAESGLPNPYLTTTILYIDTSDTTATICYSAYDSTPATITVATTRTYTPDVGSDSITQSGRRGCATVTGLTASTRYFARMNTTGGRYRDTFSRGRMAEFRTKPYAILEDEYLTSVRTDANTLRSTSAGTTIAFGCHLVWAQANGFVDDFPATYENLTMWQGAVDNMAAAGCTRISINISLAPWIENDATDITRYTDIFTYIKTTKGLGLDLHPQASGRAKTAIQALPACPNGGNPCYDGTFDTPGDWFQGAKGAMRALAQLPATARPHEITVVHEPTSANGQLGISGSAAQWDPQVGNFANDATYGIQNVDTTIIVGAGCHGGEAAYCALFSDRAGVDRIGLDHYGRSTGAAVNIINDALAADGTPKEVFIEEFSHPSWTNTGTQSEQNSIHGYGYARSYSPTCWACDWADAAIRRFSGMGATTINLFWTQPLRYYAADGANDNGLSTTYNNAVAGSPTATLTNFGQFMLNHPLLN